MILTENLSKQFDEFLAVDRVSLQVEAGQVLGLLGPNGAGKTTTVRMLTSILRPTQGKARVAGFDVVEQPSQVRASVGVLTEQHGLYERMPAGDYLEFFGQIYGLQGTKLKENIQHMLDIFGLLEFRQKRIGEFSKGMRQKLALARALMHDPPVLLLDEPTSAMDPESARLVRNSIRSLRSAQRAILICTHNLAEAEELSDQIAIIRQGRIIAQGKPTDLKKALLGPVEYEVRLASHFNGWNYELPSGVILTERQPDAFRFRTDCPEEMNPRVLAILLGQGLAVISLQEVPRSLEQVYLQAMNVDDQRQVDDAG
ncbi:MAG: ABC transporter ATP-binding protein [Omnitrophica WOR_2 bacterium]